jgi:lysophospholipase L1-like esterase
VSRRAIHCLAVLVLLATAAEAQTFRYMAFGDSITAGRLEFDPTGLGGYPGRLPTLISCALPDCTVVNKGKDGEQTGAGVTRIEGILDTASWDVVLLMEGTNDIFQSVSNNTIKTNLALMDTKARDHGVDTLHASIIHLDPDSTAGGDSNKVAAVQDLRTKVQTLAAARNRYFADPWTRLCPTQSCFNQNYHNPPGAVGHPNPAGFDIMADEFRDAIVSRPVPALPVAVSPSGTITSSNPTFVWNKESGGDANWYELRLKNSVGTTLHDAWYEENTICPASQCSVNLGSFADGQYTWEVRGRNPRGRSSFVLTAFTIQTLLPPTAATPTAPTGYVADGDPLFEWQREAPVVATAYRLEVSDTGGVIHDEEFASLVACGADSCSVDPFDGAPLAGGEYTWRVQGSNAAGTGPWSDVVGFEVVPGLIFADGFESGDLSAWGASVP